VFLSYTAKSQQSTGEYLLHATKAVLDYDRRWTVDLV